MPSPVSSTKPHLSAKPTRNIFDAWNSSSTGHQRAENRLSGSTSWRDSRSLKLAEQFSAGAGGGKRISDTVGAGSSDWGKDGRLENGSYERGASGLRKGGQLSVAEAFAVRKSGVTRENDKKEELVDAAFLVDASEGDDCPKDEQHEVQKVKQPQIFDGLCIYVNGSTAPTISDHKLKGLLVTHGARMSISLGRRTVTHVILGRPNGAGSSHGAGGGLAATKIQKEIASKVGGGVKFVTVDWILESIRLGKRAPEGRFEALRLAPKGTANLMGMFAKAKR